MVLLLVIIGLALAVFLFFRGLFLLVFRSGARRKGLWTLIAGFAVCIATLLTGLEIDARNGGWSSASEQSEARAAGVDDPTVWRAKKAADEEIKLRTDQAAEAEKRRLGFHCLSPWDGSNTDLVAQIVSQLRDPDSFKHIETRIGPNDQGTHPATMEYRATNGFGGYDVAMAAAIIDAETCKATVLVTE